MNVLQWHDPQAETGSLSDRATVVGGAIDDHLEHPVEDASTTITTTEEDTHITIAPEGPTTPTPTMPTDSTGPAVSGDLDTPTRYAPLLQRSRHQRHAPDRFGYPFESRGRMM